MRTSTFRKITASFAALAEIVSLGSSPALASGGGGGGGGGGHFGGGGTFIGGGFGGGGFHVGGFGGAVFTRAGECRAAHTAITASTAVTMPVW
jgi:hypothetical protein